jgi:hypothetical protein
VQPTVIRVNISWSPSPKHMLNQLVYNL